MSSGNYGGLIGYCYLPIGLPYWVDYYCEISDVIDDPKFFGFCEVHFSSPNTSLFYILNPNLNLYFSEELKCAYKYGYTIYIKRVLVYHRGLPFREYINSLYNVRLKYKMSGDTINEFLTKLTLNSIYGRFALDVSGYLYFSVYIDSLDDKDRILIFDYVSKDNKCSYFIIGLVYNFAIFNDYSSKCKVIIKVFEKYHNLCHSSTKLQEDFDINLAIASSITSYGRIAIFTLMNELERVGCRVIYSDTDSLIVGVKSYTKLPSLITKMYSYSKLGFLKNEISYNRILICVLVISKKLVMYVYYQYKIGIIYDVVSKGFSGIKPIDFFNVWINNVDKIRCCDDTLGKDILSAVIFSKTISKSFSIPLIVDRVLNSNGVFIGFNSDRKNYIRDFYVYRSGSYVVNNLFYESSGFYSLGSSTLHFSDFERHLNNIVSSIEEFNIVWDITLFRICTFSEILFAIDYVKVYSFHLV